MLNLLHPTRRGAHLSPSWAPPAKAVGGTSGWLCLRHHQNRLPPPWRLQRVQIPMAQRGGSFKSSPPYHSSSAHWFSYSTDNSCRWFFGKQRKGWMGGFCCLVSNFYFSYSQVFGLGKSKREGETPLPRMPGRSLWSRACCPRSTSCLGDRLNHSYRAKKIAHQHLLYLCLNGLFKSYRTWGFSPPFSLLCLNLAFSLSVHLLSRTGCYCFFFFLQIMTGNLLQ